MAYIIGIESSCDDTSAAVLQDTLLLSNVMASQEVHKIYGGVVPELASRAHQQHIVPVVSQALEIAGIRPRDIDAIAFTQGPGLLGSLLVGTSFAKGLSLATGAPLIRVNHLMGHVLSHFIEVKSPSGNGTEPASGQKPDFPFLCLLVSGGHTQIIKVTAPLAYQILGQTIDDAVGEAFDKGAKLLGLEYPGGPQIDRLARTGDPGIYGFSRPHVKDLDFSFSGVKTSFLYFLRDKQAENPGFIAQNKAHLAAGLQKTLIDILLDKVVKAVKRTGINQVALAGGVSANSGLRERMVMESKKRHWEVFLPPLPFTTDNAAMIAITGYYKWKEGRYAGLDIAPVTRSSLMTGE
ncbi:MAG: tRNA (adenosine(37)-N6)-threonylcarbamoyltransferase complex transferase subunit TsaD [Bacteroidales bacterium]|jgi:N6-L-threonylcarbamoyladenine synthase|nr:tRNA (adenosine(37)-N6)-threonylcarbamoyltransferase complex transferase subunit TsaD [Bacteroidales bacterium]NLH23917.1 tRNA (adenosine(37)-N6)-threonylcarbamoyltransferase complex transferase subunit TsaD [Bacteroidales bacterium]HPJ82317.1 tRNA (adenosine(37)-N6)-threonylcarbamoyltransferase complex transferase subunit TsaD [Bacteroidales bacterium]